MADFFDEIIRVIQGFIDFLSFGIENTKQFPQVVIKIFDWIGDIFGYIPPFLASILIWFIIAACCIRFLRW